MNKDQISHDDLVDELNNGIIKFFFQKVGGKLRIAHGTTNLANIPSEHQPSGGSAARNVIPFFDVNLQEWRSVSKESVVWGA